MTDTGNAPQTRVVPVWAQVALTWRAPVYGPPELAGLRVAGLSTRRPANPPAGGVTVRLTFRITATPREPPP